MLHFTHLYTKLCRTNAISVFPTTTTTKTSKEYVHWRYLVLIQLQNGLTGYKEILESERGGTVPDRALYVPV